MKPTDALQPIPIGAKVAATSPLSATPDNDPLIGTTIGQKYKITGAIARGGMGRVYRALQMPLGRAVALKTLSLRDVGDASDTSFHRRFELEAAACSELTHPNTVRVFDYGFDGEVCYLVMELVGGISLQRMIREQGPLSAKRVMHVGRQLCGSLGEAHGRGIIHRDLKPSNVLICDQGDEPDFVKVVDFGIAKTEGDGDLTKVGQIIGSPHYMAPEQIRGKDVDGRADVYSLGVCLYFALTGRKPFDDRDSPIAVMMAQLSDDIPTQANTLAEMPASLNWVIARCLERNRDDRFESMLELRRALRLCQEEQPGNDLAREMVLSKGRLVRGPEGMDTGTMDSIAPLGENLRSPSKMSSPERTRAAVARPNAARPAEEVGDPGSADTVRVGRSATQELVAVGAAAGAMLVLILEATAVVLFGTTSSWWDAPPDASAPVEVAPQVP